MTTLHTHLSAATHALDNAATELQAKLNRRVYQDLQEGRFTACLALSEKLGQVRQLAAATHQLANTLADPVPPQPPVSIDRPQHRDRLPLDRAA